MKLLSMLLTLLVAAAAEPPLGRRPPISRSWPHQGVGGNAKQISLASRHTNDKQKTLVVQIRSDEPVPLVYKGRYGLGGAAHLHRAPNHQRGVRPIKLTAPLYLKHHPSHNHHHIATMLRKPFKLKLSGDTPSKLRLKPASTYGAPFKYEKPSTVSYTEMQKLPFESHANFQTDQFTPIHTIPAPNLVLHDNHLSPDEAFPPHEFVSTTTSPKPQAYHHSRHNSNNNNQYQVLEENTNDLTIIDPFSGSQKLFAPDPDPSLATNQIRPANEPFNQPSNNKPLPVDVQANYLLPVQPLVQIVGAQALTNGGVPEIYPIQSQLQPLVQVQAAAGPVPIYNPTYLVTQSNNLYTQHKQHLFKPSTTEYVNADLTQQVASNGQILQAAKDPRNNIHPVLDSAPQFAALIAAPSLEQEQQHYGTAPFHLENVAASSGGFVVSNYYDNGQDSSQLLQAYAEELAEEQQQADIANNQQQEHEFHQQHQFHQQQPQHAGEGQVIVQQSHLLNLQQQVQEQQRAEAIQRQQQAYHDAALQLDHPFAAAFHEHERLAQQRVTNSPLRIFVPDDEVETARLQKRADVLTKGTVEDASGRSFSGNSNENSSFHVSSSVEVSHAAQEDNDVDDDELQ